MSLAELRIENLRCIESAALEFSPELNLIAGENGAGKTSILEAIFLLGRGRSFRTRSSERLIRHGQPALTVFGRTDDSPPKHAGIEIAADGGTRARINGENARSLLELSGVVPVQAIDPEIHKLVDWCHVIEKLAPAARVIYGEDAANILQRWRLTLLNQSSAAEQILDTLRASDMEYVLDGGQRPVHDAITYLKNHAHLLDFAKARQLGLPIGSGNVEATCKSLFNVRMKRGGARWKETTGEHIVQLRALALSDRWSQAMQLTMRPLRKAVRPAA